MSAALESTSGSWGRSVGLVPRGVILIVDDSREGARLTQLWLEEAGFVARRAATGEEALAHVAREPVDLVLLDLHMPGMDGLEVLSALRQGWDRAALPVVIYTHDERVELRVQALRRGANDVVAWSAPLAEVQARVEAVLDTVAAVHEATRPRRLGTGPLALVHPEADEPHARRVSGACRACGRVAFNTDAACSGCETPLGVEGWAPLDRSADPWLGRVVGDRYLLLQRLGAGTVGAVYEAVDRELERTFAVKIVELDRFEPAIQRHLVTEVRALARLSNPHVIHLYEVLRVAPGVIAMVMDFVRGRTLADLLRYHGRVAPEIALEIVQQLALALWEVHALGLIHRDVKPENIMVDELPGGRLHVRLLDFGVALPSCAERAEQGRTFSGTPLYAAPEQNDPAARLDERCDTYALGAVLYELLTGAPPFWSDDFDALMRLHLTAELPALPDDVADPDTRRALDRVIAWMMAKHPALRPASMTEVMEALHAADLPPGAAHAAVRPAAPPLATSQDEPDTSRSTVLARRRP